MTTRRGLTFGLLVGLPSVAALGACATPVRTAEAPSEAEARAAVDAWVAAVVSGDRAQVERVLAPEFQIQRPDGSNHDKAGYLQALPAHQAPPRVSQLRATHSGDSLVATYVVEAQQTVRGRRLQRVAPRLTVFRREAGRWLVVAHANFANLS